MNKYYLPLILVFGIFSTQSWAPPPGKGGATGGAEAAPDISKCDLNPSKQTKVKVKDKDGKEHFICTGQAICGGQAVPVSCKVSEKEPCPIAKQCIVYEIKWFQGEINCCYLKKNTNFRAGVNIINGGDCGEFGGSGKWIGFKYPGSSGSPQRIAIKTKIDSTYYYSEGRQTFKEDVCFELEKGTPLNIVCNIPLKQIFVPTVEWATDTYEARRGRPPGYPNCNP